MINTSALIPVVSQVIGGQSVQTVDARALHSFLEVDTRFNDWVNRRIDEYGFAQDVDFISILNSEYSPPRKDYALTLDMAKELAMVERTPKGKQARQYFIECEKRLRSGGYAATGNSITDAAQLGQAIAPFLRAVGVEGNMLAIGTNNVVVKATGVNLLEMAGMVHLLADPRGMTYTPTELGGRRSTPISAKAYNILLSVAGMQTRENDKWIPTPEAAGLYEWLDTGKRHSDGTPVKQLKWFAEVDDRVRLLLN